MLAIDTRDGVLLTFGGVDLLDGTPVLDIKPYIPFADSQAAARAGFVAGPPPQLIVEFSAQAAAQVSVHERRWPDLATLLRELLAHPEAYEVVTFDDEKKAPIGFAVPARAW